MYLGLCYPKYVEVIETEVTSTYISLTQIKNLFEKWLAFFSNLLVTMRRGLGAFAKYS